MGALWLHSAAEFGRLVRTRQAGDFDLRLSKYAPSVRMPMHRHSAAYFCFVVRGGMDERCPSNRHQFHGGSLHFHPQGEAHASNVGAEGMTSLSIIPKGDLASRTHIEPRALDPRAISPLARRCYEAFCDSDDASDLMLESAALELLARTLRGARTPKGVPAWIGQVRDHMHAHYMDRIALADLSAIAGVHPVHLVRAFRQHLGDTPGAYVRRLRIEAARTALRETLTPIIDIALDHGFSSQSQFTRHFHRETGLPPAAYRRRYAKS